MAAETAIHFGFDAVLNKTPSHTRTSVDVDRSKTSARCFDIARMHIICLDFVLYLDRNCIRTI